MKRVTSAILSPQFFGALLFAFSAGLPPFDDATEVDLTLHMLQHVLIIISGAIIAYPFFGRRMLKEGKKSVVPWISLVLSGAIIVFWHLPGPWDAAVLNPGIHLVEHFSFLTVGLLAGSLLLLLSDSAKIGALTAAFFGHMGYAVALISPWNIQIYSLYPLADQVLMGWVLLLTGPSLVVGIAYVVARDPEWLGGFSGQTRARRGPRETFLNRARVPRWVAPLLSGLLIVSSLGYFGMTAYALANPQRQAQSGPTVFIVETPVSWQYSPRNITVVLGVNSTVTWSSRSISYDTVTDPGGGLSSGPIAPGQTFTFTFSKPGVYDYYCQYHPWMTGSVTVLPQGPGQMV